MSTPRVWTPIHRSPETEPGIAPNSTYVSVPFNSLSILPDEQRKFLAFDGFAILKRGASPLLIIDSLPEPSSCTDLLLRQLGTPELLAALPDESIDHFMFDRQTALPSWEVVAEAWAQASDPQATIMDRIAGFRTAA